MSRIYLDYNATSPYANSVLDYLASGDLPFANPSSAHSSGKRARKLINEATSFLLSSFNLSGTHNIVYHSGATEFFSSLVFGFDHDFAICFFASDHPCVVESAKKFKSSGGMIECFSLDENGDFDFDSLVSKIQDLQRLGKKVLLNYTWVHNETGVVWPLSVALKIKKLTGCLIHIDAVQSVAKVQDFLELVDSIDYYTYSAHKFGALKGLGFTFIKNKSFFNSLIVGGNQQSGKRAGTENAFGIHTIRLALNEVVQRYNYLEALKFKNQFEKEIIKILGNKGEIVGLHAKYGRNTNTVDIIFYEVKADVALIQFDLHGIDVSSGSACSVQSLKDSPTLVSMGKEQYAKHSIRISFGPLSHKESDKIFKVFDVLKILVK